MNPTDYLNPLVQMGSGPIPAWRAAKAKFTFEPELLALGATLATMEVTADDSVGTACTDCVRRVIVSPAYMEKMRKEDERLPVSVYMHEVMHKRQAFMIRFEAWAKNYPNVPRDQLFRIFNVAADYYCNWVIKNEWRYPIHSTWLYNHSWSPSNYSTESLASHLLDNPEELPPPPGEGNPCEDGESGDESGGSAQAPQSPDGDDDETDGDDDETDGDDDETDGDGDDTDTSASGQDDADEGEGKPEDDGSASAAGQGSDVMLPEEYNGDINNVPTPEQLADMEHEIMQDKHEAEKMAKGAAAAGKQAGDGTGFTSRFEYFDFEPAMDFRGSLQRFANKSVRRGKLTWYRPNSRRRTSQGIPLPARHGKTIGQGIFAIDSSGSTSGALVKYFLDETESALDQLDYQSLDVIWCDRNVNHVDHFDGKRNRERLYKGEMHGGGGTRIAPVFAHVRDEYRVTDVRFICYLTDGGVMDYDIANALEIHAKSMPNVPVLWVLDDPHDYTCQEFAKHVTKARGHSVAYLPVDWMNRKAS